jgi:tetratricopeptide (TPR) repeat protein
VRSIELTIVAATIFLLLPRTTNHAIAGGAEQQICDIGADYSLGVEDYPEAIRRHVEVVLKNPDDALAHYHLGFALGMVGDKKAEVREYQRAEALGLSSWDLFLNLGLAQLENDDFDAATDSLRRAVLLGEDHPEAHFNLALVEERRGVLADAELETLASLRLNSEQPDARNLLGVICAQKGETARASKIWRDLVRDLPDYEAAHANLAILSNLNEVAGGETAAVDLPRAAAVNAIQDDRGQRFPTGRAQLSPRRVQYNGR